MEEQKDKMVCKCGWCGMCNGTWSHGHMILRILLAVVIAVVILAVGIKIGELRTQLYDAGYGGNFGPTHMMRGCGFGNYYYGNYGAVPMMQPYGVSMPTTGGAAPAPATAK